MTKPRVELPGSKRDPLPGREILGPAEPSEKTYVTVVLRRKEEVLPITPYGAPRRRDEYLRAHGASEPDLVEVRKFAEEYALETRNENLGSRIVELHGTVDKLSQAFGVTLEKAQIKDTIFRHRTGFITLPEDLIPAVHAVLGLDNRPTARPHRVKFNPADTSAIANAFSPRDVARLYSFPPEWNGSRQTIAIIELDGGVIQTDVDEYFRGLNIRPPAIRTVLIDGQTNEIDRHLPQHPDLNADDEVAMDIEIAGAVAPGSKQVVYFAQNTDQSFLKAINTAIFATPQPVAISISWGMAESSFSKQAMRAFESAFQDAANLGIPVCVSAGDGGSFDATGSLQVDFPASAPHALGCGGTKLTASGGAIISETVWNSVIKDSQGLTMRQGTGGGVSQFFAKPVYQAKVNVPAPPGGAIGGRGVPDVCGNADPATGYRLRVKGVEEIIGGTSAAAPLWAGLIARFGQALGGPVGFLHPLLYKTTFSASCFRDVNEGNNDSRGRGGLYQAASGWDACTGLGSPIGTELCKVLGATPPPRPKPAPPSIPRPRPQRTPTPAPPPFPTLLPHRTPAQAPPPFPRLLPVASPAPARAPVRHKKFEPVLQSPVIASRRPQPAAVPTLHPRLAPVIQPPSPRPAPAPRVEKKIEQPRSAPPPEIRFSPPPPSRPESCPVTVATLQSLLVNGNSDPVAVAGIMGLVAVTGIFSAAGIVAAIALSKESE